MNQTNRLRLSIGFMAGALPFLLILGSWTGGIVPLRTSLSSYAWSNAHVVFTAILTIAGNLIMYREYGVQDRVISTVTGIALILVACFPCTGGTEYLIKFIPPDVTNIIHGISASIAFSLMGYMSFFLFTKSNQFKSFAKYRRNVVYKACGIIIFATLLSIAVIGIIPGGREATDKIRLFLIQETIVLEAFAFSWLVKGGLILKDNA